VSVDIVTKHVLAQEHIKLNEKEKKALLDRYTATIKELPKITINDPAIVHLGAKAGDIIKIVRRSRTAGTTSFYRGVIDG
jgi:DNA-directed RNA polymerase subunit H